MIIKKIKLILSIIFVVSFFIFGLNNNYVFSQACTDRTRPWSCTNYDCDNLLEIEPWETPIWKCKVINTSTTTSPCSLDWWGGGSCVYYVDESYCRDPTTPGQQCTWQNCGQIAPRPWVSCGTAPTPTPTPTPTPGGGCKDNGQSCSGGGGSCCSGYCNGTVCATAPTPTPSNCKANGSSCAGGGGVCCSGYCDGTVCAQRVCN